MLRWVGEHRWVAPAAVMVLAAVIRFFNITYPSDSLIFDEVYYVKDAASQLVFGYPTSWPADIEYAFGPDVLARMTSDPSNAVHPPLGKWLIGLGMLLFGAESSLGWRFSVALFGTLTVGVLMLLAYRLTRSVHLATLAGFLLAIEGVSIVMSRVGLLDGLLAFFALLGALFIALDYEWVSKRLVARRFAAPAQTPFAPVFWWRPWLLAAAVAFGCATAVKWSGAYFFIAFALVTIALDATLRRRLGLRRWFFDSITRQAPVTALLGVPLFLLTYLASWTGWIFTTGGWGRAWAVENQALNPTPWLPDWLTSLFNYHLEMLSWHSTLTAEHPYLAHPLTWPLALRPTSMFFESAKAGEAGCSFTECAWAITPIPNVLIWWGGFAAIVWLVIRLIRRVPDRAALFTVAGLAAGYLPWLLTFGRSAVFQFYTVAFAPYLALALALALWRFVQAGDRSGGAVAKSRRWIVGIFLAATTIVSLYFMPLWLGTVTSMTFWNLHMWLPGWR